MIRAGITNANINNSKYLFLIADGNIDGVNDDDVVSVVVLFTALWILNPKRNDDVPIKRETKVRIFCVIAGMIATGASRNKNLHLITHRKDMKQHKRYTQYARTLQIADYHFSINEYRL